MKTLLTVLISFTVITSLLSGFAILMHINGGGPIQLDINLLKNTPFSTFLIPGLVLTFIVGGANLLALIHIINKDSNKYNYAIFAGVMLLGWICIQISLIQNYSWLQLLYFIIAIFTILIAYQLKGKWAV